MTERSTPQNRSSRASCSRGQRWPAPPPRPDGVRLKRLGRGPAPALRFRRWQAFRRRIIGPRPGGFATRCSRGATTPCHRPSSLPVPPHGTLGHGGHRLAVLPRHPQSGHADFVVNSHGFVCGMLNPDDREYCLQSLRQAIDHAVEFGAPGVITFTGMGHKGISDAQACKNCVEGWKQDDQAMPSRSR